MTDRKLKALFNDSVDEHYKAAKLIGKITIPHNAVIKELDSLVYGKNFRTWLDSEIAKGHIIETDGEYMLGASYAVF